MLKQFIQHLIKNKNINPIENSLSVVDEYKAKIKALDPIKDKEKIQDYQEEIDYWQDQSDFMKEL